MKTTHHDGTADCPACRSDEDHELAHELCDVITNAAARNIIEGSSSLFVSLAGIEMAASVLRRAARDAGIPREAIQRLREGTSACARVVVDRHKATLAERGLAAQAEASNGAESWLGYAFGAHGHPPEEC